MTCRYEYVIRLSTRSMYFFVVLTQVLKVSRDLQTQLSDQEQMVTMHRNHSADLQECVQAISGKLFEANLEVQRLHRELMAQRAQPTADLDEECIDIAVAEIKKKWVHPVSYFHTIGFRVLFLCCLVCI
jgi:hypothetical protein